MECLSCEAKFESVLKVLPFFLSLARPSLQTIDNKARCASGGSSLQAIRLFQTFLLREGRLESVVVAQFPRRSFGVMSSTRGLFANTPPHKIFLTTPSNFMQTAMVSRLNYSALKIASAFVARREMLRCDFCISSRAQRKIVNYLDVL